MASHHACRWLWTDLSWSNRNRYSSQNEGSSCPVPEAERSESRVVESPTVSTSLVEFTLASINRIDKMLVVKPLGETDLCRILHIDRLQV
jgi:hypothetical protein